MRLIISGTAGAIALLTILSWANLALAQLAADEMPGPITVQTPADQMAEDRIRAALQRSFSGNTSATTLSSVLDNLARSTGLPIELDKTALEDASIEADSPVSVELPSVSVHSALGLILEPLALAWTIRGGRLLVTTPEKANNLLILKVYPVRDLVNVRSQFNPWGNNYQPLMQTITDTVAPDSWDEVGGPGAINPFDPSGSLVIAQTFERHEEIAILLAALRQARDMQPVAFNAPDPPPHVRRHVSRHDRQREPAAWAEPPRSVVAPAAQWLVPRVHE